MKGNMKRWAKRLISLCLGVILVTGAVGVDTVSVAAATNKALKVSYSFNGQGEKDGDECWYNNGYGVYVFGTDKMTAIKGLKMSVDLYIPKTALKKAGSVVTIGTYLDCNDKKGDYVGDVVGRIEFSVVKEKNKVKLYAWDCLKEKNVGASKYAACKAGKGAYKNYYIVSVKNNPFCDTITIDDKAEAIKKNTKYGFNMGVSVCGQNNKGTGAFYIDNMKVMSGAKKAANVTFSSKPKFFGAVNRDKALTKSQIKIVKF